jgi:hypothetical protein
MNHCGFALWLVFWATLVLAASFPDCENGPLKENKVCDLSAGTSLLLENKGAI